MAYFTDDIHGRSDIVLGRSVEVRGEPRTVPMVAGVPQNVVDDAFVLAYGTDRALEVIRTHASELALVLVEPVRTRNPDLQPLEFLRELRRLADESGFLLVFDEIVTGFRAHSGGVQALFDIHADITTFGKVLGGGLPIGVVAGASEYVDVIDGGSWSFGDDSFPEADITASGGTFIKHPLTLAAAKAVLTHLDERGPSLQAELNERTAAAVAAINGAYEHDGLPIHIEHFSSFFRPAFIASTRFAGIVPVLLARAGGQHEPTLAVVPLDRPQRCRHRGGRGGLCRGRARDGPRWAPGDRPTIGDRASRGARRRGPRHTRSGTPQRRPLPRRAQHSRSRSLEPRRAAST